MATDHVPKQAREYLAYIGSLGGGTSRREGRRSAATYKQGTFSPN